MFTAVRLSRLLALLFCLAIVAAITFWAGQLMAPKVAIAPSPIANSAAETSGGNASSMAQLFGNPPPVQLASAQAGNMSLQGLLSGTRPAAVIVVDGKPARPFGLGDEVQSGIKVKSISSEQVVLDRNGEQITLAAPTKRTVAILTSNEGKPRTTGNSGSTAPASVTAPSAVPAFGAAAITSNPVPPPASPYPAAQPSSAGIGTSFSPPVDPASVGADAGSNTPRPRNQMKEGRVEPNPPK
jgi:general secretion pathway protein C